MSNVRCRMSSFLTCDSTYAKAKINTNHNNDVIQQSKASPLYYSHVIRYCTRTSIRGEFHTNVIAAVSEGTSQFTYFKGISVKSSVIFFLVKIVLCAVCDLIMYRETYSMLILSITTLTYHFLNWTTNWCLHTIHIISGAQSMAPWSSIWILRPSNFQGWWIYQSNDVGNWYPRKGEDWLGGWGVQSYVGI